MACSVRRVTVQVLQLKRQTRGQKGQQHTEPLKVIFYSKSHLAFPLRGLIAKLCSSAGPAVPGTYCTALWLWRKDSGKF